MLVDATRRGQTEGAKRRTAVPWRLVRQAGRRLSWGVADQAVSSLTNFAVSIYIARTLGAVQYGAFSLAYVTYGFALNASRGLATDPLLVRFSGTDVPTWRRAVVTCTGTAMIAGLATGSIVLVAAGLMHGAARLAFFGLGLTLPGLLLQDSWRFAFFALGRGSQAFINDVIWGVTLVPALVLLRASGHADVFWFVFAWGATATLAAAVGPLQARVVPRLAGAWEWLLQQRDLGARYLAEGTANSAANQLRNYGVGLILGLAALGYLQAAGTLMGPFQVILYGMGLVALPEAARVLRRSPRHMALFCGLFSVGLTLLALAWGVTLLVALPKGLGQWLLGPLWRPTYPLVLPTTLFIMGGCASGGAGMWLHALAASRRSLRAAVFTSVSYVLCTFIGAAVGGTLGSIRGAALGTWIGTIGYWWQLRQARRESSDASERTQGSRSILARLLPATAVAVALIAAGATGWVLVHHAGKGNSSAVTRPRATATTVAPRPTGGQAPPAAIQMLKPVSAVSFDPYGNGQAENSRLAPLAIDASSATAWHTGWYASARLGNLKPGTGLLLDMRGEVTIKDAVLTLGSARGADLQLRVGDANHSLQDLRSVANATDAGGRVRLRLIQPAHARYVLIWFTRLPPDTSGTFQASVFNIELDGSK
jgi:O-antigen/teichoic acid export membrane protein